MPYKLDVLIEKRVILTTVQGEFSSEEGRKSASELAKFLDTCWAKTGIHIANMTDMKSMSSNLIDVRDSSKQFLAHPNHLLTVIFESRADKVVLNFLTNSVALLLGQPVKTFASEAEAVKFIITKCPELAESLPLALREYHEREG